MKSSIEYTIDDISFSTRSDILKYCIENGTDINSVSFSYENLPLSMNVSDTTLPIDASKEWLVSLKNKNKPLVLMFGGGVDSIFALQSMIRVGILPDYILVYTSNPFRNGSEYTPFTAEPMVGLEYLNHVKSHTPAMKNVKIWRVHLDENFAERSHSDLDWPKKRLGYHHGCDSIMSDWFSFPEIPNYQDFTIIKGGDFPRITVNEESISFFLVDLQLGGRLDTAEKTCYDFIIDNPKMYNAICVRYAKLYKDTIKESKITSEYDSLSYVKDKLEKFSILTEHLSLPKHAYPPQFDKGFDCLHKHYSDSTVSGNDQEFIEYYNKSNLKCWGVFLEAELRNSTWYKKYKESMVLHRDWIEKVNSFPGLITTPLTINFSEI